VGNVPAGNQVLKLNGFVPPGLEPPKTIMPEMTAIKIACTKSGNLRKVLTALRKSLFLERNKNRNENPMTTQRKQSRNIVPLLAFTFWGCNRRIIL
jgi:hypothetical protein